MARSDELFEEYFRVLKEEQDQAAAEAKERGRVSCLASALEGLDERFTDPRVCRRELKRMFQAALVFVDQLTDLMAGMNEVDAAALNAAVVEADGDERLGDELFTTKYGGQYVGRLSCIFTELESAHFDPPQLTAAPAL